MANTQSKKPIGDLLLELVQRRKSPTSRLSRAVLVVVLFSVLVLAVFLWRMVSDITKKNELESLCIAGEAISTTVEERLTGISVQLSSLNGIEPKFVCNLLNTVFYMYPEFTELSILDKNRLVIQSCANPDALGEISRPIGSKLSNQLTVIAGLRAKAFKSAAYSLPYFDDTSGGPYADLIIPPDHDRTFVARIALPVTLRQAATNRLNPYQHYHLLESSHIFTSTVVSGDVPRTDDLRAIFALPPLPTEVELGLSSSRLSLLYSNSAFAWSSLGLITVILISILLLWRFQIRQARTEETMRARIIVQEAVSESLSDGLSILSKNGKILFVNDAFEKLFGYEAEEVLGLKPPYPFSPTISDKDRQRIRESLTRSLTRVQNYDFEGIRKDRTRFDCRVHVFSLIATDGEALGFMATYQNVTQANKSARELRDMQQRFTRVLETMDAEVSVISTDTQPSKLLFANALYLEQFGESTEQHLKLSALFDAENKATAPEIYDTNLKRWYSIRRKDISWIDNSAAQMITAYDVTVRHENREIIAKQLAKAELSSKLINMGEMASSLAHELNQPLAAINNYSAAAKMLLENKRLTEKSAAEALDKIHAQANRASLVMRRIRSFAKKADPVLSPTDIDPIADEVIELTHNVAEKYGVEVVRHVESGLPKVLCDALLIEQVLINLMKNAMEASENASWKHVELEISRLDDVINFRVIDFGNGLSEQTKKDILQPFFSTKSFGMGIGLNLCRSIIESHEAHLVIADNPAGGAIFSFALPIARGT